MEMAFIWLVVVNIVNKQLGQLTRSGLVGFGLGVGL
jgi:hypothetical protein